MAYNYFCPNTEHRAECEFCNSKGDFQSENKIDGSVCPQNRSIVIKLMGESMSGLIGPKMNKEQIKVDRKQRSTDDFIKNTLPTMDPKSKDGQHFNKKYPGKKIF